MQSRLPADPEMAQVCLDFDGTITRLDVLDELIRRFAVDDSWHATEALWSQGRIGSEECLRHEFSLIRVTDEELRNFLDEVPIDPGAVRLFRLLADCGVPTAIFSDGIEAFIMHILRLHRIAPPPVFANQLERHGNRLALRCPLRSAACESKAAHCKCASVEKVLPPGRAVVYIGDGRSDLCMARKATVRFAKGTLASLLRAERLPYCEFATLNDVAAVLERRWAPDEVTAG